MHLGFISEQSYRVEVTFARLANREFFGNVTFKVSLLQRRCFIIIMIILIKQWLSMCLVDILQCSVYSVGNLVQIWISRLSIFGDCMPLLYTLCTSSCVISLVVL